MPTSPNKRWSPAKASWLESALNRPESPTKRSAPALPFGQQPEWKSQLAKLKAQRQAAAQQQAGSEDETSVATPDRLDSVGPGGNVTKPALPLKKSMSVMAKGGAAQTETEHEKETGSGSGSGSGSDEAAERPASKSGAPPARPDKSAALRRSLEQKEFDALGSSSATPTETVATTTSGKEKDRPAPPPSASKPSLATSPSSSNPLLSRINSLNSTGSSPRTPSPNKLRESPSQFDFRANLRKRDGGSDSRRSPTIGAAGTTHPTNLPSSSGGQSNELQNAFAKLKRTNTGAGSSPPVKPPMAFKDEFRENITRGKDALNQTGGPKKSERVDEFKESLNQQRESFKIKDETGHPVGLRGRTGSILEKKAEAVPEALERRRALKSSMDLRSAASSRSATPAVQSSALPDLPQIQPLSLAKKLPAVERPAAESEAGADSQENDAGSTEDQPAQQSTRPLPPALASRVNPGLASLLSRGRSTPNLLDSSSRGSSASSAVRSGAPSRQDVAAPTGAGGTPGQGPALTHMTKGRARGPKRRAPKAAAAPAAAKQAGLGPSSGHSAPVGQARVGVKSLQDWKNSKSTGPAPPVAKKSDDVRRISGSLSKRSSTESLGRENGSKADARERPAPPPLAKKPSVETLDTEQGAPRLAKKFSFETRPVPAPPTSTTTASLADKPPARAPVSSISDRLNKLQGGPMPLRTLRKSPTWGGKSAAESDAAAEAEARPPVPEKDGVGVEMPKKSPPPLRSPSSRVQLGGAGSSESQFPALQKARTWGARTPLSTQIYLFASCDMALRTGPRRTIDGRHLLPASHPLLVSKTQRIPKPPSHDLSCFPLMSDECSNSATISPVPEASGTSSSEPVSGTDPELQKPARRRPTPLNLQGLPSVPLQPTSRQNKPLPSPQISPYPERQVAGTLFASFFDMPPRNEDKVSVDPAPFFERSTGTGTALENPTTVSAQIWEVQASDVRTALSAGSKHVLFDDRMYLLQHTIEKPHGVNAVQTYLWVGDEVTESSFNDVSAFARKTAKDQYSKLQVINQGRETACFTQALGGIIVIRRGRSARTRDAPSSYMLCGRQYLGQIMFDEVDVSASSLSSGHPFILVTSNGQVYLWEGQGSGADELGSARLIAMDLLLTGDIKQVLEGEETDDFWALLASAARDARYHDNDSNNNRIEAALAPRQAGPAHWRCKRTSEKYAIRLFRVDHDLGRRVPFWARRVSGQSPVRAPNAVVQEIERYVQRDLDPAHIHIVDAFFEIYVIVGERAAARHAEFATALFFAQEYAITAVSMEDRPFLPHVSVALYGVPNDVKRAFRKWQEQEPVAGAGLKQPDLINLRAAIEAIR
ncbi:hypothetical protein KEM52_006128 [Ascosphaera acerosa]|nr:hypothetical protein KEM52_006128 [Ascosphaera acerosa]